MAQRRRRIVEAGVVKVWSQAAGRYVKCDVAHVIPEGLAEKGGPWADRLIGCPVWWLQRVSPLLEGKQEIIAAIYIWRRHVVVGQQPFGIANTELKSLGVDRYAKYRMLAKLEAADVISVNRNGRAAPLVTILKLG